MKRQTILNTRIVMSHPVHHTVNHELGMYRIPASPELKALLTFAHRPLAQPRIVGPAK